MSIGKDHLTPEARSRNMGKIKQKDSKPEILLRSMLHRAGYRFRKNVTTLPGKPDIVLPKYRTVIFVHGCFWHRHDCRRGQSVPTVRREFWENKFERNVERDRENETSLQKAGWQVLIVWECELKNVHNLPDSIRILLGSGSNI